MRVIAGSARSVPLEAPMGTDTRPTADKIKETLFNILQFELPGAACVDLFAGSGALGIEALSRGSDRCIFVDDSRQAVDAIKKNLLRCHLEQKAKVYRCDASRADLYMPAEGPGGEKLIIFMDPPYRMGLELGALRALEKGGHIDSNTLIVLEAEKTYDVSKIQRSGFLYITRIKEYKNQKHIFMIQATKARKSGPGLPG